MGQIVRRGRKGRPPKADLGGSRRVAAAAAHTERELRRSSRRRNVRYTFDFDDFLDDEDFEEEEDEAEEEDEEDRRKEKKLELLLKLQGEDELTRSRNRHPSRAQPASASSQEDDDDEEDRNPSKKRRISRRQDDEYEENEDEEEGDDADDNENENPNDFEECGRKAEARRFESSPGTPSGRCSPFPLPDKKMLELILDKLQKKDIYGVYAEPVDPEELPDYHDVIEHPMDFSTVRNKLRNGSYATLEQFESDVFLICSNAMQYNDSDTIYYKQASSIQELATRKFQKIRINIERAERLEKAKSDPRPKSSPLVKKQIKKPVGRTVQEPAGSDFSSGATLANAGDAQNDSNAFAGTSGRINSIDGPTDGNVMSTDNLDREEVHSGKGHLYRCGRKSALQDENRRATYEISTQSACTSSETVFSTFEEEIKHLVPVGLYADHSYAKSLACFAATLGPIAWEYASRRITQALPAGSKFGRGWIGEYEPFPSPVLMLKNHTLKEPSFLAKSTQKVKAEKKVETMEPKNMDEANQQYVCPKPPTPNNIESKPFFLGTSGKKPPNSSSPRYHSQKCPSPNFIEPEKKHIRQFELNSQPLPGNQSSVEPNVANSIIEVPAGSKSRNLSSSSAPSQLLDAKGKDNSRHSNTTTRLSSGGVSENVNKGVTLFPHGQGHGPIDSNNASAVAARAWMSMGASGGFKQANESQISAESLYNPSRNFHLQNLQFRPASGMHFLPGKGIYPFHAFMPHTTRGVVGIEGQVPNRPVMFPQFVGPIDPSRFHPRQNLNSPSAVQSIRLNRESVPPPDLNISFQSAGSPPSRPSSGILVDSQQPDLALQL